MPYDAKAADWTLGRAVGGESSLSAQRVEGQYLYVRL